MSDRIEKIAAELLRQHQAKARYETLSGEYALADIDEAYAVQDALQILFSEAGRGALAGHKIGLTSKPIQELCKVDRPVAGGFFENDIHTSPAKVQLSDFTRLGVEFEIAATIGDRVPDTGKPYDRSTIRPYVAGMSPAFELIEDRDADYSSLEGLTLAADNSWCGGVVLGDPIGIWPEVDFATQTVTMFRNDDEPVHTSTGACHPFETLAWLANQLISRGQTLEPGRIVMTGSTLATIFPVAGDRFVYEVDELARVEIELV